MATQFEIDCALMAGNAYRSTRDPMNRFPIPGGWTQYSLWPADSSTGFEAVAFQSAANSNNIVISFAGTDPLDILGDQAANISLAAKEDQQRLPNSGQFLRVIRCAMARAFLCRAGAQPFDRRREVCKPGDGFRL